jgi:hypothetical protein
MDVLLDCCLEDVMLGVQSVNFLRIVRQHVEASSIVVTATVAPLEVAFTFLLGTRQRLGFVLVLKKRVAVTGGSMTGAGFSGPVG